MLFMLIVGLMGNVLAVDAEENLESAEVEVIKITPDELTEGGEDSKSVDIRQEYNIGQGLNIDVMAIAEGSNTDANSAKIIQVNSVVNDVIAESGQQRWYAFAANAGKLTLNLNFTQSANVDYDIYLYKYNDESGNIELVDGAETTNYIEHFACMVDEGIYFVFVNGYSGYDAANPYTLGVVLSTYYDQQEPDDRIQNAYNFSGVDFSLSGTIDNQFDIDFQKYTLDFSGSIYVSLTNNGSRKNIYAVDVLNANGVKLLQLNQNTNYLLEAPQGTYYFRVYCSTFGGDYNSTYTLKCNARKKADRVEVTHAGDAPWPIEDYVDGPYWRVYGDSNVKGFAYDENGYLLPDADVEIKITVALNNQTISAYGKTDSQGFFDIKLNIGNGVGRHSTAVQGISRHYYDIVPVEFASNGAKIGSNVQYFYHFAYQIGPYSAE